MYRVSGAYMSPSAGWLRITYYSFVNYPRHYVLLYTIRLPTTASLNGNYNLKKFHINATSLPAIIANNLLRSNAIYIV